MPVLSEELEQFKISHDLFLGIANDFRLAMLNGLAGNPSALKMLPSYIGAPIGSETGIYLALDFGGTNIRVQLIELHGGGRYTILKQHSTRLKDPAGNYDFTCPQTSAEALFDYIAKQIAQIAPVGKELLLGHTFSFPCRQNDLKNAVLITWTKEIMTADAEGENVTALLTNAVHRQGLTHIYPAAVINDTVGTFLAGAYAYPDTDIASICGTGHNTAYYDRNLQMIINMESGNFDKLPLTKYDTALDAASEKPREQLLEKMVAGHYLGELFRLITNDLVKQNYLTPACYRETPYSVTTMELSAVITGSPNYYTFKLSQAEYELVRDVAVLLRTRSARLAAATFCGALDYIDPTKSLSHNIIIDGSLFQRMPGYAPDITLALATSSFSGKTVSVNLLKDGSGVGAAIAAAIAGKPTARCI